MPVHAEKRTLPYTPEQMFDLVAGVEEYPDFLPWCLGTRIVKRESNAFEADLTAGHGPFKETFRSRVTLNCPDTIHVTYLSGPMKNLSNEWRFIRNEDGSCTVDFYVSFTFGNPFLRHMADLFFNEIVRRMVKAFEERAKAVYGSPSDSCSSSDSGSRGLA